VDATDTEIGVATDPFSGIVTRRLGDDLVVFFASTGGLDTGAIEFLHTSSDCSGDRYVTTSFQRGLAYFAQVHLGTLFYTKTADPGMQIQLPVGSVEKFEVNEDATLPWMPGSPVGKCTEASQGRVESAGPLTMVTDQVISGLTPPLRIK